MCLLFLTGTLVGCMPKSIIAFLEGTRDFDSADKEKRDILNLYRDDILKINNPLYFYTHYNEEKRRNDIEIDFIISNNKLKYNRRKCSSSSNFF